MVIKSENKPIVTQLFMVNFILCCHNCCTASKPAWKLNLLCNLLQSQVTNVHCKQSTVWLKRHF